MNNSTTESSPNFRFNWLPAVAADDQSKTVASPVCGWIVHNKLDQSLLILDSGGHPIGTILRRRLLRTEGWEWKFLPPPMVDKFNFSPDDVNNLHLRAVIVWLLRKAREETTFLTAFLETLERSSENTKSDGPDRESDNTISILLDRPLALLRAGISTVANDQVPESAFQLSAPDGGLAVFWVEDSEEGFLHDTYFVASDEKQLIFRGGKDQSSPERPGTTITVLLDPRGSLVATTGESAARTLRLSPEEYLEATGAMQTTFRTGPIIIAPNKADNKPILPNLSDLWNWIKQPGKPNKKD